MKTSRKILAATAFGLNFHLPVHADYDGSGHADPYADGISQGERALRLERKARSDAESAESKRIENENNKLLAAKKAEALSHIKDEDVLNFPARDVDASCSFDFHTQASLNACVDHAQPYYNIGKLLWDGISLTGRKECLLMAEQYGKAYQFYVSLWACLQVKETEADMKRHRTFNAW